MGTPFKWKLEDTTLEVKDARGFVPPYTISLSSAAASRDVELSIDGGETWFKAAIDTDEAACIGVVINSRVSAIRFAGEAGDTARVIANG